MNLRYVADQIEAGAKVGWGKKESLKILDNYGIDLGWSSRNGYIEIVKLLLEAGADVHEEEDFPLRTACSNDQSEIVQVLLEAGADINARYCYAMNTTEREGFTKTYNVLNDWLIKIAQSV